MLRFVPSVFLYIESIFPILILCSKVISLFYPSLIRRLCFNLPLKSLSYVYLISGRTIRLISKVKISPPHISRIREFPRYMDLCCLSMQPYIGILCMQPKVSKPTTGLNGHHPAYSY